MPDVAFVKVQGPLSPFTSTLDAASFGITNLGATTFVGTLIGGASASLGIGASPTALLHLHQAGSGGYELKFASASPAKTYGMGISASAELLIDDVTAGVRRFSITSAGVIDIPSSGRLRIGLATYASNAAAVSGGLTSGMLYTDGSGNVKVVL